MFGYDKYSGVGAVQATRGTFCDLATKLDVVVEAMIEVEAIGMELKDNHVRQAVDYARNRVEWVLLTHGVVWRVYRLYLEADRHGTGRRSLSVNDESPFRVRPRVALLVVKRAGSDRH